MSYLSPYGGQSFSNGSSGFDFQELNECYYAAGNILPSTFVTILPNGQVQQSQSGDWALGVSASYAESIYTNYAAQTGSTINIYGSAQECWIRVASTVLPNQFLKPAGDGSGYAVPVSNYSDYKSAFALQGGSAGDLIRVRVMRKRLGIDEYTFEYSNEYT